MRKVYNQHLTTLVVNNVKIQDFYEGSTITFSWDGGEVGKTQGTDGASINLATLQGATLSFVLRESSRSRYYLQTLRDLQYAGGEGVTVTFLTGVDVQEVMTDAFISNPGTLSTGDKTMNGIAYVLTSPHNNSIGLQSEDNTRPA